MDYIFTWIREVLLVILSLSFFQILIPDTKIEGYLKYVFSLVIMAIVLEPIIKFINQGIIH